MTVAHVLDLPEAKLLERRRGSLARAVAAWALVRHAGLTQREAAAVLGMSTGAAVSQQLTKWQTAVGKEQRWQSIVAELNQRLARANY
jgi:predicted transcriptional regulator